MYILRLLNEVVKNDRNSFLKFIDKINGITILHYQVLIIAIKVKGDEILIITRGYAILGMVFR